MLPRLNPFTPYRTATAADADVQFLLGAVIQAPTFRAGRITMKPNRMSQITAESTPHLTLAATPTGTECYLLANGATLRTNPVEFSSLILFSQLPLRPNARKAPY